MKKLVSVALLLVLLAPAAYAKTMREAASQASSSMSEFWKKESERSGIHMPTGPGIGNFFQKINPVNFLQRKQEEYNARKAGK